jgi:hypothetical protein
MRVSPLAADVGFGRLFDKRIMIAKEWVARKSVPRACGDDPQDDLARWLLLA